MPKGRYLRRVALLFLFGISSALLLPLSGQNSNESQRPPSSDGNEKVILEVVNNHITVGRRIPSVYLKLFSDGTAECHALVFTGREEDNEKRKVLTAAELADVKATLNNGGLRDVKGRYELPRAVFDSWMEWEISIHASDRAQDVTVAFAGMGNRPYPPSLAELGCSILKLREEVCGDDTAYYRPACKRPSRSHQ